jgi:phenylacetate-CoA ligase
VAHRPYWQPEAETLPRDRIDALQEEKLLGDLLPWAYDRCALIREAWDGAGVTPADVRTMDDFRNTVPFVDKDGIRRFRDERGDPYGGVLGLPLHTPGVFSAVFSTSGTTGDPTLAPYAGRGGATILARDFWAAGVRPGDHMVEMLFTYRGPAVHETIRGIGAIPVFVDHDPAELPRLLELSREYRPVGWYNLSGPLVIALEELAATAGTDLAEAFTSYRSVIFAGEPLGPRARRVTESWGLRPFLHTGVGDVGAATECEAHDGCHVWEDFALVEVLDPDGAAPVPDGERGELVATTLINKVTPLVRYRSDDLVRLSRETCTCGRTHARIWPIGRKGDEVVVGGRSVLPVDVWPGVEAVPETAAGLFQVVRTARVADRLRLRVGARSGTAARGGLDAEVAASVRAHLRADIPVDVEVVDQDELLRQGPPHKIPRVVKV